MTTTPPIPAPPARKPARVESTPDGTTANSAAKATGGYEDRRGSKKNGYRLFLTYDLNDNPDAPQRAMEQVAAWLRGKQYPDTPLDRTALTTLRPGHELAVIHHEGRHQRDWRVRLEHPDTRYPDIRWRTTLTLHQPDQGQGWLLLTVDNTGYGPVAPPALTQRLLDALTLQADGWDASSEAVIVDTHQVDDLLEAVTAPERTSIFLIAGSSSADADLVSGVRSVLSGATRRLRGLAHAIVLSPGATEEFAAALGREHAVVPWTLRIYLPDVDPAVPSNQHRHKSIGTDRLYDQDVLARNLARIVRPHHQTQALPRDVLGVLNNLDRTQDRHIFTALTTSPTVSPFASPAQPPAPETDAIATQAPLREPAPDLYPTPPSVTATPLSVPTARQDTEPLIPPNPTILDADPSAEPTASLDPEQADGDSDEDLDQPSRTEEDFESAPEDGTRDPAHFEIDPELGYPRPWLSQRWRDKVASRCEGIYWFRVTKDQDNDTHLRNAQAARSYERMMRALGFRVRKPLAAQRRIEVTKCPGCAWSVWSTDTDLHAAILRNENPRYAIWHARPPLRNSYISAALSVRTTRYQPLPDALPADALLPRLLSPDDYARARQHTPAPAAPPPAPAVTLDTVTTTAQTAEAAVAPTGPVAASTGPVTQSSVTEIDPALVERLARDLAELRERVDELQDDLDQARADLDDARLDAREAHDDRRKAEATLRRLRADLTADGWFERAHQDTATTDDLIPVPSSYEDLLRLIPALAEHGIVLTSSERDALRNAEALDDRDPLGDGAVIAWEALHALADYRRAKINGDHTGNMLAYITSPPSGTYRTIPKGKFAGTETKATRTAYSDERTLPVPTTLHPDGEIVMTAHFRLGKAGGMSAPRMYYFDDTSRSGNIYVGYIGPHLRNTQT